MPPRDLVIVLFEGFAALDAVGPADVFATANQIVGETAYALRYVASAAHIAASNGMVFAAEPFERVPPQQARMVLVPGADEGPLLRVIGDDTTMNWIRHSAQGATRTCAVCSGAFILASLDLLKDRRATTHWRGLDRLARWPGAPRVERSALFVEDGEIWTSAGVTAGIDMALAIVERDLGRKLALAVARELVLFLIRPGGQAQFSEPLDIQEKAAATDLRALAPWLETHLATKVSVAQMASAMAMSERTFHRRCLEVFGETPLAILQRLRLERVRSLLGDVGLPEKVVAGQAGFVDVAAMRRLFCQKFGVTPKAYRSTFAARRETGRGEEPTSTPP